MVVAWRQAVWCGDGRGQSHRNENGSESYRFPNVLSEAQKNWLEFF